MSRKARLVQSVGEASHLACTVVAQASRPPCINDSARLRRAGRLLALAAFLAASLCAQAVPAEETLAERRARIERMDPLQRAELARAEEQFAALDPAEQERLRKLHEQIAADPRQQELLDVMQRYCAWVQTLPPYERAALRELPPDKRIERIKQLRERQRQEERRRSEPWGARSGEFGERLRKLAAEEADGLGRWFDEYMKPRGPDLIKELPEPQRGQLAKALGEASNDPERSRSLHALLWVLWQLANRGKAQPLDEQALERLRAELSPSAKAWVDERSPGFRRWHLTALIDHYVFTQCHEELAKYLEKGMGPKERDELMNLPPEIMRRRLWWRYLSSKWPGVSPDFEHGPGLRRPRGSPSPMEGLPSPLPPPFPGGPPPGFGPQGKPFDRPAPPGDRPDGKPERSGVPRQ